ncbi:hypothetical protein V8F06_014762 [Rhypophila decipiens]
MSFGFSIGDIILITQLTRNLIDRIRHGPALFRELEGDLSLTQSNLDQLRNSWADFSQRTLAATTGVNQQQGDAFHATLNGVQNGLRELAHEVDVYGQQMGPSTISARAIGSFRFTGHLQDLRERLSFHMGSLNLVMQNLTHMQGRAIADALQTIHEAQGERRREIENPTRHRSRTAREREYEASLHSFQETYLPGGRSQPEVEPSPSDAASTTTSSADYIMRRWLHDVDAQSHIARMSPVPESDQEPTLVGSPPRGGRNGPPRVNSPGLLSQDSTAIVDIESAAGPAAPFSALTEDNTPAVAPSNRKPIKRWGRISDFKRYIISDGVAFTLVIFCTVVSLVGAIQSEDVFLGVGCALQFVTVLYLGYLFLGGRSPFPVDRDGIHWLLCFSALMCLSGGLKAYFEERPSQGSLDIALLIVITVMESLLL